MSEDRGVTNPVIQQGQNLDRRRNFFENQIYEYWIRYDTETHGKWRCILW